MKETVKMINNQQLLSPSQKGSILIAAGNAALTCVKNRKQIKTQFNQLLKSN